MSTEPNSTRVASLLFIDDGAFRRVEVVAADGRTIEISATRRALLDLAPEIAERHDALMLDIFTTLMRRLGSAGELVRVPIGEEGQA